MSYSKEALEIVQKLQKQEEEIKDLRQGIKEWITAVHEALPWPSLFNKDPRPFRIKQDVDHIRYTVDGAHLTLVEAAKKARTLADQALDVSSDRGINKRFGEIYEILNTAIERSGRS